ncbi:MAG TPA: hypothetical protein VHO24_16975 [Opitutaceae bacterium]|nr:hypothetical protein [Opitutaceae bacterium]
MTAAPPTARKAPWRGTGAGIALGAALLLATLLATGCWMLFSNLALYDDEGYILISAREYFAHGRLYELVYSQYGPAFYVMTDAFQHLLAGPVDHTAARLLTLGFWIGTAVCCAGFVLRQTGSRSLTLFALTTTFLYLYFITDEPFHPGSLVFFLLALSLLATTELLGRERLKSAAAVAGLTGAILLLTKINVGVFYVAALGTWALLHTVPSRWQRSAGIVAVTSLVLLAAALMHTLWRESWVQVYLALFATGAVTVFAVSDRERFVTAKQVFLFFAAGAAGGLLILFAVWLRGTSVEGLLNGVLLGPLRHPGSYSYPVDWRPGSLSVAALSLALAVALPGIRRKYSAAAADGIIVGLRLVLAAALLVGFAMLMRYRVIGAVFSYVAPLIWIWMVPLSGIESSRPARACRGLIGTVLLLQYLHAYPVGGSQESWGTFLFWPLAALGLGDVRLWLRREGASHALGRWWPGITAAALVVLAAKVGWTAKTAHDRYASRSDLALPGAAQLHLLDSHRTAYHVLTLNAAAHADVLFSLPGMFSFNLWTGLPTPTQKNTTLWFTLLNDREQTEIIRAIEAAPRTCIVLQETLVELMTAGKVPMRGLLHDYLQHNFSPAFRVEGFSFLVRNGRTIAPLEIARLLPTTSGTDTHLEFCFASDGTPIAAIEARDFAATHSPGMKLDATNARAMIATINSQNRALGGPQPTAWPIRFKGLARVSLQFKGTGPASPQATTVFQLKGPEGETLGLVRFAE